jgi:hypothetical protein
MMKGIHLGNGLVYLRPNTKSKTGLLFCDLPVSTQFLTNETAWKLSREEGSEEDCLAVVEIVCVHADFRQLSNISVTVLSHRLASD